LSLASDDEPDTPAIDHTELPAFVEPEKRHLAKAFVRAARESKMPVATVQALAWRESRWRAEAYNPDSGATGIGQLLPETATFVATELLQEPTLDPEIAVDNIRMTARYLAALTERFDGDERKGMAAYLQGSTSVANDGISAQTADYLADIEELRERFAAAARGRPGSRSDPLGR
jgi:soluble lytic murein transglycosylase-like protein